MLLGCQAYSIAFFAFDVVFTAIFLVEAALKIVAAGCRCGPDSYWRNSWDWVDFIIVLASCTNVGVAAFYWSDGGVPYNIRFVRGFRVVRALRPLRFLNILPGTRTVGSFRCCCVPTRVEDLILCSGCSQHCSSVSKRISASWTCHFIRHGHVRRSRNPVVQGEVVSMQRPKFSTWRKCRRRRVRRLSNTLKHAPATRHEHVVIAGLIMFLGHGKLSLVIRLSHSLLMSSTQFFERKLL